MSQSVIDETREDVQTKNSEIVFRFGSITNQRNGRYSAVMHANKGLNLQSRFLTGWKNSPTSFFCRTDTISFSIFNRMDESPHPFTWYKQILHIFVNTTNFFNTFTWFSREKCSHYVKCIFLSDTQHVMINGRFCSPCKMYGRRDVLATL